MIYHRPHELHKKSFNIIRNTPASVDVPSPTEYWSSKAIIYAGYFKIPIHYELYKNSFKYINELLNI